MTDLSRTISGYGDIGGFVWDPHSQRLLFTSNGALHSLNPQTGQITSISIPGAHTLTDVAVSPDGRYVLIGETFYQAAPIGPTGFPQGPSTLYYHRVWLGDGRVETLSFTTQRSEISPADVAVLSDNRALLATDYSGSGSTELRIITGDAPSPTAAVLAAGIEFPRPTLTVSESHRYVLVPQTGGSGGRASLFDGTTGQIVGHLSVGALPGHSGAFLLEHADISEAAGLVAIPAQSGSLIIADLSMRLVRDLSFDFDFHIESVQFTPDGKQLFVMPYNKAEIAVFDTRSWQQLGVIKTQAHVGPDAHDNDGALEFSSDGRFLFLDTETGIEVIDFSTTPLKAGEGSLAIPRTVITTSMRIGSGETIAHGRSFTLWNPDTTTVSAVFTIAGTVTGSSVWAEDGGPRQWFEIESTGVLRLNSRDALGEAVGYFVPGFKGPSFENHGLVEITSTGDATGVSSYATAGAYLNYGTIRVDGGEFTRGFFLPNLLSGGSGFRNWGALNVSDHGGQYGQSWGVYLGAPYSWFRNEAGASIVVSHRATGRAQNTAVSIHAHGDYRPFGDEYGNAGLIQGDIALDFSQQSYDGYAAYARTFVNEATGVLNGEVRLNGNGITLQNAGAINGAVVMGGFAETYDGSSGGRVTGMVSGGGGNDLLIGGPAFDYLHGNHGDDDLRGGAGDDWVVGGKDQDQLAGNAGADLLLGNLGNDTSDGGDGADVVRGGQGDDIVRGGTGDDWLSGDRGDDTVTGGAGADIFHAFAGSGMDWVTDFNRLEGDRIYILPGSTFTAIQQGGDVIVDVTDATGVVGRIVLIGTQLSSLTPGWIFGT
ncbi:hypothetical protein [Phenylobacterium sp.]|jgi:WD40 repeat protein|uniref:hypothetical protein n=1 Tax=Phenylobacterium sp. TaxID=1871053 RepID=UPI002F92C5D7